MTQKSTDPVEPKAVVLALRRIEKLLERQHASQEETRDKMTQVLADDSVEVPPGWVLRAARANMKRNGHSWESYFDVLTSWYGIPSVRAVVNPSIKPYAHYLPGSLLIETRDKVVPDAAALHEFFHHLWSCKRGVYAGEAEQAMADAFAAECIKREP